MNVIPVLMLSLMFIGISGESVTCGPVCAIFCEHGNVLDANGCPTCQCKTSAEPVTCGPVCAIYCLYGHILDANGCPTCRCRSIDGMPQCGSKLTSCSTNHRMDCQFVKGCYDCACVPAACPYVNCVSSCEYGYKIDEKTGCHGCNCKSGAASLQSLSTFSQTLMVAMVLILTTIMQKN